MSRAEWRNLLLWLHISIAVVGFGPTFTFPFWASMARKAGPEHVPYTLQSVRRFFRGMVIPLAVLMPFSGLALIYVARWDLWANEWLWISIALYTIGFFVSVGMALPNLNTVLGIITGGQAQERMAEIQARGKRQRLLGFYTMANVLAILGLMVWKPGA